MGKGLTPQKVVCPDCGKIEFFCAVGKLRSVTCVDCHVKHRDEAIARQLKERKIEKTFTEAVDTNDDVLKFYARMQPISGMGEKAGNNHRLKSNPSNNRRS